LNEVLSGLGPLGVGSAGVEDGVGAGAEADGVGLAATCGDWEVAPVPLHAVSTNAARQIADSLRTLREVYLCLYDAAVEHARDGIGAEVRRGYEDHEQRLVKMIAPLDQAQLDLAAAPHLWSVRTLACHIVAARAGWMHSWMGEGSPEFGLMTDWDEDEALATRSADEIVGGLEESFAVIKSGLERWSAADLAEEFVRPTPNAAGERPKRSRQWIIWHLVEHDVHHGGEISFSLGMHGVPGLDL